MASFVVLTPPDSDEPDDRTVLIRDEFAWLALIFPFIWALWFRLWFAAAMLLLLSIAIAVAISLFPAQSMIFTASSLLVSVFVALEGNGWRIAKKERQGWAFKGVVEAQNHATAEEIWFTQALEKPASQRTAPSPPPAAGKRPVMHPAPAATGPALGLLDYEDRS